MTVPDLVLRLASWLVPRGRRADWIEEWRAELWALSHGSGRRPAASLRFVLGAPRHAVAERLEGWTFRGFDLDLRDGLRRLARAPGLTLTCMLIVALATAANTAVFSVVNATLLRTPPAIADADRLAQIGRGKLDGSLDTLSYPVFALVRRHASMFETVAAYSAERFVVDAGTGPRYAAGLLVTSGYFRVTGVPLYWGREASVDEERGGEPVAVVSHAWWQRRLAARHGETSILVNGRPVRIVGVAPVGFVGTDVGGSVPELWMPVAFADDGGRLNEPRLSWLWAIGRMRPDTTLAQAQAAFAPIQQTISAAYPHTERDRLLVVPGVGLRPQDRAEALRVSSLLMGSVALVLVIASVNVAGLLVARSTARGREVAVRLALGASRFRIARECLAESLLMALASSLVAFAASLWFTAGVRRLLPYEFAVGFEPDARVFGFTLIGALTAGLLFGLLPAVRTSRTSVMLAMRQSSASREGSRLRACLVVVQLVLSFTLLSGSVMLVRSLVNLHRTDPGFATEHTVALSLDLDLAGWNGARAGEFLEAARLRIAASPDVTGVGFARRLPIVDTQARRSVATGVSPPADEPPPSAVANFVDEGFFQTLQWPILRGRAFARADRSASAKVAIVSENLARRLWANGDPIGRSIQIGFDTATVVGVAGNARVASLRDATTLAVFLPLRPADAGGVTAIVRVRESVDPRSIVEPIRSIAGDLAPRVPIARLETFEHLLGPSLAETQLVATLLGIYGVVTLTLAAAGVFGLLAFAVRQRRRELGIRLALGASPRTLRWSIVVHALRVVAMGVVPGVLAAAVAGHALERQLFGTTPGDPVSLALVALAFTVCGGAAAWYPARQAASIDPVQSLRED